MGKNVNVVRLYGQQDMVKQNVLAKMYGISPNRIHIFEKNGLQRYQLDGKTVFYSIREFEDKIKELSTLEGRSSLTK